MKSDDILKVKIYYPWTVTFITSIVSDVRIIKERTIKNSSSDFSGIYLPQYALLEYAFHVIQPIVGKITIDRIREELDSSDYSYVRYDKN